MPYILSCSIDQYADDSTLSCVKSTVNEISTVLNESCSTVSQWMVSNQLCLNADKTHLMLGGTSQKLLQSNNEGVLSVTMNGFNLSESEDNCENVLGVFLQPNLK